MNRLSKLEQETIITFNGEEENATLYTASPAVYRRMVKRGFAVETIDSDSWIFEIPKKSVRLPTKPRSLTAKQRQSAAERVKALSKTRKEKNHV